LDAEVSDGDTGANANARLGYLSEEKNQIYVGYALESVTPSGTSSLRARERKITAGTKFKATDSVAAFVENNWGQRANQTTIAQTYGISYDHSKFINYTAAFESGHVSEPGHASLKRHAISLGALYNDQQAQKGRLRVEYSTETGKTKN